MPRGGRSVAASADLDTAPLAHGPPAVATATATPREGAQEGAEPSTEGVVARVDRLIAELDRLVRRA